MIHSAFQSIKHLSGFTPPLSKQGKRYATYGDSVLRERLLRSAIERDELDLTGYVARVGSRENHARVVRILDLPRFCSLPINIYDGGNLEDHSLSTILESVIGECALNKCEEFIAAVVRLLEDRDLGGEIAEQKEGVISLPVVREDLETAVPETSNVVAFVYEWAASRGHDEPVITWSRHSNGHCCKVSAGGATGEGCDTNKRKAKYAAFANWRKHLPVTGEVEISGSIAEDSTLAAEAVIEHKNPLTNSELKKSNDGSVDSVILIDDDVPYHTVVQDQIRHLSEVPFNHDCLKTEDDIDQESKATVKLESFPSMNSVILQSILG